MTPTVNFSVKQQVEVVRNTTRYTNINNDVFPT